MRNARNSAEKPHQAQVEHSWLNRFELALRLLRCKPMVEKVTPHTGRLVELYGFWVQIHHGWYRVLTIMSPEGITAARAFMREDTGTEVISHPGHLTQYIERERGALQRLIDRYEIRVLERAAWNTKKCAYGERIYT